MKAKSCAQNILMNSNSFSHHRITIPPVNFTNACHRNGVLALGTFIVEWQEGVSELEKFLLRKPSKAGFDEDHPIPDLWNPHYADILGELFPPKCVE